MPTRAGESSRPHQPGGHADRRPRAAAAAVPRSTAASELGSRPQQLRTWTTPHAWWETRLGAVARLERRLGYAVAEGDPTWPLRSEMSTSPQERR